MLGLKSLRQSRMWMLLAGGVVCAALVWGGLRWREGLASGHSAWLELLKLMAACLLGLIITTVHRSTRREKAWSPAMEHAQVLLCVAGALMMIIIGDSLARAFGIAGGASIVRFRTPVEDPKEAILLFLVLGLGMACGLGAFALAGLGTAFLCAVMLFLERTAAAAPRAMTLTLAASGAEFPTAHVEGVLARHGIPFETREVSHGKQAEAKYRVVLGSHLSLEQLSEELRSGDSEVRSVAWEKPKKRE